MNWSTFFDMGGYAFEVWTSWGLTLLVLCSFIIIPKQRNTRIKAEIRRQISREQRQDNNSSS